MSFFLGIFPDKESVIGIEQVSKEISSVFEGFDIPVRWSRPDQYHLTLIHFGESLPFYKRFLIEKKINKLNINSFRIRFGTVKLGISRKYKELIYLDLAEGGDDLRKLFLDLRETLKIKNDTNFIPHLTLGRVSKELTNEEYNNILRDLNIVSKKIAIEDITFYAADYKLVKSEEGNYEVLANFCDLTNTSS